MSGSGQPEGDDRRSADPYRDLLSWRRAAALTLICWATVLGVALLPAGSHLDKSLTRPVEFALRRALGRDPAVDPRLKIFAFDDRTASLLQEDALPLRTWEQVLRYIDSFEPAAVLIDDAFDTPRDAAAVKSFLARMSEHATNVTAGVLVTDEPVLGRPLLNFERPDNDLTVWAQLTNASPHEASLAPLGWLAVESIYPYGPHPELLPAFTHVGHLAYEGDGYVRPFVRLTHQFGVPHLAFFAAKNRRFRDGVLELDGRPVPVDGDGLILANFLSEADLSVGRTMRSLSDIIVGLKGRPIAGLVAKGDVVFLVPRMFTGHRDWIETPLGRQPAAVVVAGVINSVLTGRWITPVGGGVPLTGLAALLGALLAFGLRPARFWPTLGATLTALAAAAFGAFAFADYQVPWLYPLSTLLLTATVVALEKARRLSAVGNRIRYTLAGTISPARLEQILDNPAVLHLEPTDIVATVMIVDIVGFSFLADTRPPAEVYSSLRAFLSTIADLIHKHGGVVDKTMGDGILCFFGYDFGTPVADHPDQALRCALEIQEMILARNLQAIEEEAPVFPLRIGINTGGVYFGDLGGTRRLEPTIIGSGVNYAQRLEAACDSYCVMLGATTKDQISELPAGCSIKKRLIKVKHHDEPLEAYEVDPLATRTELRRRAAEGYNHYANIKRKDYRWPVPGHLPITFSSEHGQGVLLDFSRTGFAVTLTEYLGKGLRVNITLGSPETRLAQELLGKGIKELLCEVRWGRPYGGSFIHGLQIENLSAGQRQFLLEILRAHIRGGTDAGSAA